ncbi:hypothetical protein BX600DRAFT_509400 [Xylariales sp. PMI_506]|nr:hypothetical protein BX600DRAFT_509400 [Xylariales sp. PMI_506]
MSHLPTHSHRRKASFSYIQQVEVPSPGALVEDDNMEQFPDAVHHHRGSHGYRIHNADSKNSPTEVEIKGYDNGHFRTSSSYSACLDESSDVDAQQDKHPNYKPSALRWPFLSMLLLTLLVIFGSLAYAFFRLPVENYTIPNLSTNQKRTLEPQASESTVLTSMTSSGAYGQAGSSITVTSADTQSSSTTLPPTTSETITRYATTASSGYGEVGTTIKVSSTSTTSSTTTMSSTGGTTAIEEHTTGSGAYGQAGHSVTVIKTSSVSPDSEQTSTTAETGYGLAGSSIKITGSSIAAPPDKIILETASATIFTNSLGNPTSTSIVTPPATSTPQTTTLTNSLGEATATSVTSVLVSPVISTETDSSGVATATVTYYATVPTDDNNASVTVTVYYISYGDYFIGFFLPTIVAVLLAIPIRIFSCNMKLFQPWHALNQPNGASGLDSLCLKTNGWQAVAGGIRLLWHGQPLVFLTAALELCAALLVPLASEAVGLRLRGQCGSSSGGGAGSAGLNCTYALGVFSQPAIATLVLLGIMSIIVFLALVFLARWKTGVSTNPWSIAGIAGLARNKSMRNLLMAADAGHSPGGLLQDSLAGRKFRLDWFRNEEGVMEYGIVLCDRWWVDHQSTTNLIDVVGGAKHRGSFSTSKKNDSPFWMLGYTSRIFFLLGLSGILAMILYYENTGADTSFERFMDGQSFGVKFVFTGIGVLITFFWSAFFNSIASMSPYLLISSGPQRARYSILLSPPTNAFSGIVSAVRRRHGYLVFVALAAILSEFLTIFLTNIPFHATETFLIAQICIWSAVGILSIMILVVVGSLFIRLPFTPVDPSTIGGAMYYVCDSRMVSALVGTSTQTRAERDWCINSLGERFEFGEMTGVSGMARIGVDSIDGRL